MPKQPIQLSDHFTYSRLHRLAARRDDVIHPCKKENPCQNRKSNFRITLIIHG